VAVAGPGVIVDRARGVVYAMAPDDAIEAIDIASGEVTWRSTDAAKPLIASGDRVLALQLPGGSSSHLGVVSLAADTGAIAATCDSGGPPGVTLAIDDQLGANYSSQGLIAGGNTYVVWSYNTHYAGGAAPSPEREAASRTSGGGVLAADPATGCLSATDDDPMAQLGLRSDPDNPRRSLLGAGAGAASLEVVTRDGASVLVVARGDSVTIEVPADAGHSLYPAISGDLRHVLAVEHRPDTGSQPVYRWTLIDLDAGSRVAQFDLPHSAGPFVVAGERLVMSYGGRVQAVDIAAGADAWHRPLRQTGYRGPYPPSAPR
jgi:hypothetical protein